MSSGKRDGIRAEIEKVGRRTVAWPEIEDHDGVLATTRL